MRAETRDDKYAAWVVRRALRDPDEVDVAVKCLRESGAREFVLDEAGVKAGFE